MLSTAVRVHVGREREKRNKTFYGTQTFAEKPHKAAKKKMFYSFDISRDVHE
jgi:hypothetical protein